MTPRILVATDGTRDAIAALRMATRLAERGNARVEVLGVHDPGGPRATTGGHAVDALLPLAMEEATRLLRRRILEQLATVGGVAGSWPVTVVSGRMAPTVAAVARERGVGRVVLGLGQTDVAERWFAREALLDLIRQLHVPVLAVPPGFGDLPRRVVVAVDFSRYSLEIARDALDDLEPGAQLHLVHVVQPIPGSAASHTAAVDPLDRLVTERQLVELSSELEVPGTAAVESHLLSGDPADEILRIARQVGAELIAAGSHGASYPGQVLMGDVYEKLVYGAGCSLLIGPPRGIRVGRAVDFHAHRSMPTIVA